MTGGVEKMGWTPCTSKSYTWLTCSAQASSASTRQSSS